jgi:hypothetical protein
MWLTQVIIPREDQSRSSLCAWFRRRLRYRSCSQIISQFCRDAIHDSLSLAKEPHDGRNFSEGRWCLWTGCALSQDNSQVGRAFCCGWGRPRRPSEEWSPVFIPKYWFNYSTNRRWSLPFIESDCWNYQYPPGYSYMDFAWRPIASKSQFQKDSSSPGWGATAGKSSTFNRAFRFLRRTSARGAYECMHRGRNVGSLWQSAVLNVIGCGRGVANSCVIINSSEKNWWSRSVSGSLESGASLPY